MSKAQEVISKCLELSEAVRPAPWEVGYLSKWEVTCTKYSEHRDAFVCNTRQSGWMGDDQFYNERGIRDAEFIAYSRQALPRLAEALSLAMEYLGEHCWEKSCDDPQCNVVRSINKIFEDGDG